MPNDAVKFDLNLYEATLIQNKATKNLTAVFNEALAQYELTKLDWLFLSVLQVEDCKNMQQIAATLSVEPPLVSRLAKKHSDTGLLTWKKSETDRRIKYMTLTVEGTDLLRRIEVTVRKELREYVKDISRDQLYVYFSVMNKIASKS